MKRRRILIIGGLVVVLLLAAGGGLAWWLSRGSPPPSTATVYPTAPFSQITPPPSLAELATRYPELADLLTNPELDSEYKDFLLAYQQGGLDAARALAEQRGLLTPQDELRIVLVLDTEDSAPLIAQLQAAGVRVEDSYADLVSVAVPLSLIARLAGTSDPGAAFRHITELSHVIELRLPQSPVPQRQDTTGEGVAVVGADAWHAGGQTGRGVKVAILDGGFDGYPSLLGGDLPATVVYQSFGYERSMGPDERVHGTACAEIVHEIAPDAELYLVAFADDLSFGHAVDWLIEQGVDVVSHSASWMADPRDGSGSYARTVDRARAAGIVWVNSAGNEAMGHYEAPFNDADGDGWHEFGSGEEMLGFEPDQAGSVVDIVLNWDDWSARTQDVDLLLLDGAGDVLASSANTQNGRKWPVEDITYEFMDTGPYYLAFQAVSLTRAVNLDLFVDSAGLYEAMPEGSIMTPGDSRGSLTVGATFWANDELEPFSSCGPTTDGRLKPDISAPDGVAGRSYNEFFGTSASTPHVAGAAALVLGAFPDLSPEEVQTYLQGRALDLGPGGPDNSFGAGRLSLGPLPAAETPSPVPPTVLPATLIPTPIASTGEPGPAPTAPPSTAVAVLVPTPSPAVVGPAARVAGGRAGLWLALPVILGAGLAGWWLLTGHSGLQRRAATPPPAASPRGAAPAPPRTALPRPPAGPLVQARYCGRCGKPLRPGARFCGNCGLPSSPPVLTCPVCRQPIRSGQALFCGHCGHRLRPPGPPMVH